MMILWMIERLNSYRGKEELGPEGVKRSAHRRGRKGLKSVWRVFISAVDTFNLPILVFA